MPHLRQAFQVRLIDLLEQLTVAVFGGNPYLDADRNSWIMEPKPLSFECPSCKAKWTMQCPKCKEPIKATTYVCPGCGTMYCIRCAIMMSERTEPCLKCGNALRFG